jgi:hypothetical protein
MAALPDTYQKLRSALGVGDGTGEDAVVPLTGTVDASGYALAVYAAYVPYGPPHPDLSAISAAAAATTITVTIPAATAALVPLDGEGNAAPIYFEVWRTDAGYSHCLGRYHLPCFDAVRGSS